MASREKLVGNCNLPKKKTEMAWHERYRVRWFCVCDSIVYIIYMHIHKTYTGKVKLVKISDIKGAKKVDGTLTEWWWRRQRKQKNFLKEILGESKVEEYVRVCSSVSVVYENCCITYTNVRLPTRKTLYK